MQSEALQFTRQDFLWSVAGAVWLSSEAAAQRSPGKVLLLVDMTGLTGRYDFAIDPMAHIAVDADGTPTAGVGNDAPTVVSMALQEQLGLKLESRKSPVAMVLIDHVEKAPPEGKHPKPWGSADWDILNEEAASRCTF
jgi:uncharacterized protein (TIGR03435 family)